VGLAGRSEVRPVPLADTDFVRPAQNAAARAEGAGAEPRPTPSPAPKPTEREGRLQIVWNHRWEYDKGPERLLALVRRLSASGPPFRLHVVGRPFRRVPPALGSLAEELPPGDPRRGAWGRIEDERDYRSLLAGADVVLSTALHDFQGLAVLEGMAAGCVPVVPDRQAYPEWVPAAYRYADGGAGADGVASEAQAAAAKIAEVAAEGARSGAPRAALRPDSLAWSRQRPAWAALLERVAGRTR